nr:sulfotransferase [Oceanococcus sp. HetDA_MAG_MS8]
MEKARVLYLAGAGRSGGTLIGRVLGQMKNFFPVGELHDTWARNFLRSGHCACRHSFQECEFWGRVFYPNGCLIDGWKPEAMHEWRQKFRFSQRPELMFHSGRTRARPDFDEYLGRLDELYLRLAEQTGGKIIVETSRVASYGTALSMLPNVELWVLHLVRDVRGVAMSWRSDKQWLKQRGWMGIALEWAISNVLAERVLGHSALHYRLMRFEDFLHNPGVSLEGICDWLGVSYASPLAEDSRTVDIQNYHGVVGNPDAFKTGPTEIKVSDPWPQRTPSLPNQVLATTCRPLLRRYGYN